MTYNYEIVTTSNNIPAKIIIHNSPGLVPKHWHKDLELAYLYQGNSIFPVDGKNFSIKTNNYF